MELAPEYCENIVVGVIYKGIFEWYVTPNDLWQMDLIMLYDAYVKKFTEMGRSQKRIESEIGDIDKFCSYRFGIKVLDTDTAPIFLQKILKYRTDTAELKEWFDIEDDKSNVYPILLVNFDKKQLVSYCPEPLGFESSVPSCWKGEYRSFLGDVPENKVYWQ